MDMAPLAAHIDQGLRLWQGPQALWFLTVPTARGAVEIAGEGMAGFSLEEQQLLVSVAPSLQVLSLRHRDLELVEAAVSAGVFPEAGREVFSPNLAEAGGRGQDTAPLVLENSRLRQELKAAAEELRKSRQAAPRQVLFAADQAPVNLFDDIVAESPAMRKVVELARLTTTTDNTVLILGESGTGQDLLAHAIHTHSRRSTGPLVVVNSARLSNGLEDSELFGHLKGAFTSAHRENLGMVAAAHGQRHGPDLQDHCDGHRRRGERYCRQDRYRYRGGEPGQEEVTTQTGILGKYPDIREVTEKGVAGLRVGCPFSFCPASAEERLGRSRAPVSRATCALGGV